MVTGKECIIIQFFILLRQIFPKDMMQTTLLFHSCSSALCYAAGSCHNSKELKKALNLLLFFSSYLQRMRVSGSIDSLLLHLLFFVGTLKLIFCVLAYEDSKVCYIPYCPEKGSHRAKVRVTVTFMAPGGLSC